jgi:hypothetical protein
MAAAGDRKTAAHKIRRVDRAVASVPSGAAEERPDSAEQGGC